MLDHSDFRDLLDLSSADYDLKVVSTGPILLICASGALMLVTFLGCLGALKDSKILLLIYATAVGAFVFFYVSGAIVVSVQDIADEIEKPLFDTLTRYDQNVASGDQAEIVRAWNLLQDEVGMRR